MDIKAKIREFITSNFMMARLDHELCDSDSLFAKGVLDSTAVLELVGFVEETFEIGVEDDELIPENLDSIDNLIVYIQRKRGESHAGAPVS